MVLSLVEIYKTISAQGARNEGRTLGAYEDDVTASDE